MEQLSFNLSKKTTVHEVMFVVTCSRVLEQLQFFWKQNQVMFLEIYPLIPCISGFIRNSVRKFITVTCADSAPTLKPPSDDDVDISTLTGCIEKTPQAEDLNNTDELIKSLIRDGVIPEDAELADTFYSSNDDFEIVTSSSDEGERLPDEDIDLSRTEFVDLMGLMEGVLDLDGSTVARSSGTKHAGHSPKPGFEEQYNLKRSDTSRAQQNPHVGEDDAEKTVVGFSVFHANVIENKISKMLEKCRSGVDPGVFEKGYEMMKQIKHDDSASHEENMKIIEEVKKLIPDRNKCMDMEQLVYMEEQLRMNRT